MIRVTHNRKRSFTGTFLFLAVVAALQIAPTCAIEPYAWADYLIWKTREDGLTFAGVVPVGYPPTAQPIVASFVEQSLPWSSGVRVGAGCMWCNDWDASLAWTGLRAKSCSSVADSTVPKTIVADLIGGVEGVMTFFATSAQSAWHLRFDAIDANLGKWYAATECITWSPYLSVKWARIDQCQRVVYQNIFDANDPGVNAPSATVTRTNDFSGVGPRLGLYTAWDAGHHVSLFGDVSGSLLTGKKCVRYLDLTAPGTFETPGNVIGNDITNRNYVSRVALQFMLGAQWEWCFWCDHVLALRAAYEAQWWPNQWNLPGSVSGLQSVAFPQGDLSFQGFTLGLGVLF